MFHNLPKTTDTNSYFHKTLKYQLRLNRNISDFGTKHQNNIPCVPHKIPLALESCSHVPALSDRLVSSPNFRETSLFTGTMPTATITPMTPIRCRHHLQILELCFNIVYLVNGFGNSLKYQLGHYEQVYLQRS